ncbi:MAG: hypothetical protein PHX31_02135 [Syntrophaceticus schinkii]|jgi:ATP-dependent Clp protease ATP-binding subunit ClpA|nr:hypothetical protein [Syntrophaceticus schinkii]
MHRGDAPGTLPGAFLRRYTGEGRLCEYLGARLLWRVIQRMVEDGLSEELLAGMVHRDWFTGAVLLIQVVRGGYCCI